MASVFEIRRREDLSEATFLLEIAHPMLARAARPGQFVIVMSRAQGERIPLTIADYDRSAGTITLVVQAVGKTTREMQRDCTVGSCLYAVVGPMGVPSVLRSGNTVACVAGGLGVAPIFPHLRAYKQAGRSVIAVVGFRTRALAFWRERFAATCDEVIVCTDDGSLGRRGLVSDALADLLASRAIDEVIAIGPPRMMAACAETTRPFGVHTTVSLNPIMVDGTGMCGGCRVRVDQQMRFACVDGPDFDGHKVDFEELIARLARFQPEERRALEHWSADCRLMEPSGTPATPASRS